MAALRRATHIAGVTLRVPLRVLGMRLTYSIFALALIVVTTGAGGQCTGANVPTDTIGAQAFRRAVPDAFRDGRWGIAVLDRRSGEILATCRATERFAPASTVKIFSAGAVTSVLGPNFRFHASVRAQGRRDGNGLLLGNLILDSGGDPALGGRTLPNGHVAIERVDHSYPRLGGVSTRTSAVAGLDSLARQVARTGIRRVEGSVLLASDANGRTIPVHLNDDDVDVIITTPEHGVVANVVALPFPSHWRLDARVSIDTTLDESAIRATWRGHVLSIRGSVPRASQPVLVLAPVVDVERFARELFRDALRRAAVALAPAAVPARGTGDETVVASLESPPLEELLDVTLKVSSNPWTLHLVEAAAARRHVGPMQLLREIVSEPAQFVLRDVTGEDTGNLVTPLAMARAATALFNGPSGQVFARHLPRLGREGTLAGVLDSNSTMFDRAQGKSGTLLTYDLLNGRLVLLSKGFLGFGTAASGREVVIAAYASGIPLVFVEDVERAGHVMGGLVEALLLSL